MKIRNPAVAGTFYSSDARKLRESVAGYVRAALEALPAEEKDAQAPLPKAIIAPHAGYIYSGPVAGSAYARIVNARGLVTRVVLAGPVHRVPVRALAASSMDGFATPLGVVSVDRVAVDRIGKLPQVEINDLAHAAEHSLEVHLPFLQYVLGPQEPPEGKPAFTLVPLAVGDAEAEATAEVFEALWGGPETLFVISTDLSHFHTYDTARALDAAATRAIEALRPEDIAPRQACGAAPVAGLLVAARKHGLRVKTLDLRNSGDTAGSRDSVVGYGAWALY
ncbi:MAG: AmmeMemoRadiSam system protein B [Planctomycetota bacterium]